MNVEFIRVQVRALYDLLDLILELDIIHIPQSIIGHVLGPVVPRIVVCVLAKPKQVFVCL
jgi:hypothetical protein